LFSLYIFFFFLEKKPKKWDVCHQHFKDARINYFTAMKLMQLDIKN